MNHTLILCAHGGRSPRERAVFAGLVNAVRRDAQDMDVIDAFVDGQQPSIADVVAQTSGPRIVVPLMLAYDRYVSSDIVRASHLDPAVTVTAPLGPDWVLAELGVRRLVEAGARAGDTIILADGAVTEDRAATDIGKAARLLSGVWGGRVHVGTVGGEDGQMADAVDVARAYGRRVVVSTYLLGAGPRYDAILGAGADVVTKPLLAAGPPDPRLVSLIVERARVPLRGPGARV